MDISEKKIEEIATQAKSQITVRSVGNGFDQPYETFISVGNITVSVRDLEDTPEDCTWQRDYQEIFYLGFHIGVAALLKSHITGKDGLLDVLGDMVRILEEIYVSSEEDDNGEFVHNCAECGVISYKNKIASHNEGCWLVAPNAHLSKWRQK